MDYKIAYKAKRYLMLAISVSLWTLTYIPLTT